MSRLSSDDLTRAGQLIGRNGEFDSSVSGLSDGRPAEWRWTFDRTPASVDAEILNSSGRVVARPSVALAGSGSLQWDGSLASGGKAAPGAYVLRLVARGASGAPLTPQISSLGRIEEVVSREGELWAGFGSVALPLSKLVRIAA